MMIFDQNKQIATKHSPGYVAKRFVLFRANRAFFSPDVIGGLI